MRLSDLHRCLQGIIPSVIATADGRGVPNITYVSQVDYLDEQHVALSCQFFNKTRRNLDENPLAFAEVVDPETMQPYRLRLRFLRSEKTGPLFDRMAMRIEAIASHTGMTGVFRLIAADVFEVLSIAKVEGALAQVADPAPVRGASLEGLRSEVRGLHWVSDGINRAVDLEGLLGAALQALEEYFGFRHTMVLLLDECTGRLTTLASRGYGASGVGAEVALGDGIIGVVARDRRVLHLSALEHDLSYGRTIRREAERERAEPGAGMEIPLPGLANPQSVLAIPLAIGPRLVGVLAAEDPDPRRFSEWHEAFLEIVGNQIALGIDRMIERSESPEKGTVAAVAPVAQAIDGGVPKPAAPTETLRRRRLTYHTCDDAIFVDDEYLIRNVPAKILWKVLREWQGTGRTEFSNRELRLDAWLGLPPVKDNLESRLILLRQRLKEKCPDLALESTGRGRFALRVPGPLNLIEK